MGIHLMEARRIVNPIEKSSNYLDKQKSEVFLQKKSVKKNADFTELIDTDTHKELKCDGPSIDEIIARASAVNPLHNRPRVRTGDLKRAENLYEKSFVYKMKKAYEASI